MTCTDRKCRRSIRLRQYDYSQPGAYFVTICAHQAFSVKYSFSSVVDDRVVLTEAGSILESEWLRTAEMRRTVMVDTYVLMPNHLHGIIILSEDPASNVVVTREVSYRTRQYGPTPGSVGAIVAGFKAATTSRIRKHLGSDDLQVWQRNYFEHIIRNERALALVREYIAANPLRWTLDRYNPCQSGSDEMAQRVWRALIGKEHT